MAETSAPEVAAEVITAADSAGVDMQPANIVAGTTPGFGSQLTPGGVLRRAGSRPFEVHLDVFQGPFELLLGLISNTSWTSPRSPWPR